MSLEQSRKQVIDKQIKSSVESQVGSIFSFGSEFKLSERYQAAIDGLDRVVSGEEEMLPYYTDDEKEISNYKISKARIEMKKLRFKKALASLFRL